MNPEFLGDFSETSNKLNLKVLAFARDHGKTSIKGENIGFHFFPFRIILFRGSFRKNSTPNKFKASSTPHTFHLGN